MTAKVIKYKTYGKSNQHEQLNIQLSTNTFNLTDNQYGTNIKCNLF